MILKQLILFALFLPTFLYGQDLSPTKERKFFIGANFSPDLCYRHITINEAVISNNQWPYIKSIQDSIYIPTFGYTTGLNVYYQFKNWFSIETGIQFSRKGYQTIPILTKYNHNQDAEIATNYLYFDYLDLPLRVNFTSSKSKVQLIASVGTVFNFLLQARMKSVPEKPTDDFQTQTEVSKYPYNKFNVSPMASLGLKFNINDRINLRVEPTLRYGLLSTVKNSFAFTYLWTTGLNVSFNYGF